MNARTSLSGAFVATAATSALLLGTGCQPSTTPTAPSLGTPAAGTIRQAAPVSGVAATTPPAQQEQEAQNWWKRTQEAQRTVPIRASVVVTQFHDGGTPPTISRYDMVEGANGRKYRITYHAPTSASGRIVLSDGTTLWQYEPDHDTVLRRPAPVPKSGFSSTVAGEADAANDAQSSKKTFSVAGGALRLEPDADSVAGRPTRVLDLLTSPNGAVVERRWIDTKTGRALQTERYDARGKPWRRVEMTQVEFSPAVSKNEFAPSIVSGTRIIDTNHPALRRRRKPRREAEAAARRVHLALAAHDFILETATKHPNLSNGTTGTTHLTYTNGTAAISIFVTPISKSDTQNGASQNTLVATPQATGTMARPNNDGLVLQGASGWKAATFTSQNGASPRAAWTQETRTQSAVAWTQNHDRLIAVAQMPVRDLLPVVGTLASGSPPQSDKLPHAGKTPDK